MPLDDPPYLGQPGEAPMVNYKLLQLLERAAHEGRTDLNLAGRGLDVHDLPP